MLLKFLTAFWGIVITALGISDQLYWKISVGSKIQDQLGKSDIPKS